MATITTSEVQMVVSLSKEAGREALRRCLKWETFDDDLNMRQSIHLDFLYDNIMFVTEKGFTSSKSAVIVTFANNILQQIKDSESITEILAYYSGHSEHLFTLLGERDFKIYTSFIFETILPHFKLFKLVFTKERDEQIPNVPCKVEPPFETKTLKETKPLNVWNYERKLEELEKNEKERALQRQSEKEKKLSEIENLSKEVLGKVNETETPLDKEKIGNIIQEVMKQFTLSTSIDLGHKMEDLREDLEFKLEKSSLPRPPALGIFQSETSISPLIGSPTPGPPPRYNAQSVKVPSSKTPKSPKPGSRNSQKSKKK